jgi:TolA-binding protein
MFGLCILLSFFIEACAIHPPKASRTRNPKQTFLAKKSHANQEGSQKVALKDANKLATLNSIPLENEDEESAPGWALSETDRLYFELSGEKIDNLNSRQIYEQVSEKYRSSDLKALEAYTNLLMTKYPRSRNADNALYLQGMLAFSIKSYAKSLESFQKIIQQYPHSNKVVSALFAKGILYKKMNLNSESENVLNTVKAKFPGSPESLRADAEEKTLKQ